MTAKTSNNKANNINNINGDCDIHAQFDTTRWQLARVPRVRPWRKAPRPEAEKVMSAKSSKLAKVKRVSMTHSMGTV